MAVPDPKAAARARYLSHRIILAPPSSSKTKWIEELNNIVTQHPDLASKYASPEARLKSLRHSRSTYQNRIDTILLSNTPTRRQHVEWVDLLTAQIIDLLAQHPNLASKYPEPTPTQLLAKARRRRRRLLNELQVLKNDTPFRRRRLVELNVVESKIDALLAQHPDLNDEKPKETPHQRKIRYHVQGLKGRVTFLRRRREYHQSEELVSKINNEIQKLETKIADLEQRTQQP